MAHILIADSETIFCESLGAIVTGLGHSVEHAHSIEAIRTRPRKEIDVVVLSTQFPDGSGLALLPELRNFPGKPEVIMVTATPTPDGAETSIRNGAWEYVEKQDSIDRMILPLIRALEFRGKRPSKKGEVRLKRDGIIGSGTGITRCLDIVREAAASDASALLYGETGVGKEVFARAIHDNSGRRSGPFVAVDCASLSRTLAGSILFGHRKGAFTGADKDKDGLVLQAHRGTLFLDEVGELPLPMQKIFLRVLQEHRFRPVGGRNEITSEFRLICATNRNLEEMVARGTFRSDLLFRMRTVVMPIPPLRERTEDIQELTTHYIQRLCGKYGMSAKGLSPDFIDTLKRYQWPGNVRELIHTLERAVLAAQDNPKLFSRHLPDHVRISIARAAIEVPVPTAVVTTPEQKTAVTAHTAGAHQAGSEVPPHTQVRNSHASKAWTFPASTKAISKTEHTAAAFDPMGTPPLRKGASCAIDDDTDYFPPLPEAGTPSADSSPSSSIEDVHAFPVTRIAEQTLSSYVWPKGSMGTDTLHTHLSEIEDYTDRQPSAIADNNSLPQFFEFRDRIFLNYLRKLTDISNGNIATACTISGLSRSYLYDLLRKYNISFGRKKN